MIIGGGEGLSDGGLVRSETTVHEQLTAVKAAIWPGPGGDSACASGCKVEKEPASGLGRAHRKRESSVRRGGESRADRAFLIFKVGRFRVKGKGNRGAGGY